MAAPTVAVAGLSSLMRDLKKSTDPRAGAVAKAMQQAGRTAADPVAAVTRSVLPQVTGRLAGDVRVTASRTGAAVRMGRASVRYAGWIEFGGNRRVPHDSFRDYSPRGRYLFPAALGRSEITAEIYSTEIEKAYNGFSWTNQTTDPGGVHD